jgi:glycosyltransferase involved in cell wall biosynthesis
MDEAGGKVMRVTFVVSTLDMSGGVKVIRDHARHLLARGHEATIVTHSHPPRPWRSRLRSFVKSLGRPTGHPPTYELDVPVGHVDVHRPGWEDRFPDADIVLSTWWQTSEFVAQLPASKGRKAHFVQDHEIFPGLPVERARASIRLIPEKIVVSGWLSQVMREEYGFERIHLALNGVDTSFFAPTDRRRGEPPIIGTLYSPTPRKNSAMAAEAMRLARQTLPALKLRSFGTAPLPAELQGQDWIEHHVLPAPDEIPLLYAGCDFWLFSSVTEGFGLPILEALACGTPVIATRAGAAPQLIDGSNGSLVETSASAMAEEIVRCCGLSQDEWQAMSRSARATAEDNSLARSNQAFEAALLRIMETRD